MKRLMLFFFVTIITIFPCPIEGGETVTIQEYTGIISAVRQELAIHMQLVFKEEEITGSYYYDKYKTKIRLEGAIDSEKNILLREYDENNKITGIFKGKLFDGLKIKGVWLSPDESARYYFTVRLTNDGIKKTFYGKWKITKEIYSGISALTKEEVKEFIGKEIYYSADMFMFDNNIYPSPEYEINEISGYDFWIGTRTYLSKIGIENDSIIKVRVYKNGMNCYQMGSHFWIKDNNSIITMKDGVFFVLTRIDSTSKIR